MRGNEILCHLIKFIGVFISQVFFFFSIGCIFDFFFPFVISFNLQSSEIKNALKIANCPCYLFIEDLICQSLNCIPRSFIIVPELFQIVKLKV